MLIMARNTDYEGLLSLISGRKVSIWTCTTCARLCYGLGGKEAAEDLASRLRGDGIEVTGTGHTSAGCMESRLSANEGFGRGSDVIISLTCSHGSGCASRIFGKETVNPVTTFGAGYLRSDGTPMLAASGAGTQDTELERLSGIGKDDAPFA